MSVSDLVPDAMCHRLTCKGKEFRCRFFESYFGGTVLLANNDTRHFQLGSDVHIEGKGAFRVYSIMMTRYGSELRVVEATPIWS